MNLRIRRRTSRTAKWSWRLIVFMLPLLILAPLLHRFDLIESPAALALIGSVWLGAAFALLLAFIAIVTIWRTGMNGLRTAIWSVVIALPILAVPCYFGFLALNLPRLNDLTTDPFSPPRYLDLSVRGDAPLRIQSANITAQLQTKGYPTLGPMYSGKSAEDIYRAIKRLIEARQWHIVAERADQPRRSTSTNQNEQTARMNREWVVQAVARSMVMGFRDDVVIRVRPALGGSRIDMRSSSRLGRHDLGANAKRITRLLGELRSRLDPTLDE